jgi:hypothetical protein
MLLSGKKSWCVFTWVLIISGLFIRCDKDNNPGPATFKLIQNSVPEGNDRNTQYIIVEANRPVSGGEGLTYDIIGGTATADDDVVVVAGVPLEFSQASGTQAKVAIEIKGDTHAEITEYLTLVIRQQQATVQIEIYLLDDDEISSGQILQDADGYLTPDAYPSMKKIWADEFSDSQLNTAFWTYEIGNGWYIGICGWGNNELQRYTNSPDNCKLENGRLMITARGTSGNYTSARIKTQEKKTFKFGRIDIRARLPKGQGIWPALWMLGANITSVSWPACGEIDIMELVGHQPATVHGTVHFLDGTYKYNSSSTSLTTGDFSDQFHVFTLRWDINSIQWYVDNQLFKSFTNAGVSNYPFNSNFFFIFNIAVGGNWPGNPDATTTFPQEMVVDYVRVFQ